MKKLLVLSMFVLCLQLTAQTSIGLKTHYGTAWQEYGELPINGFDQRINGYGVAVEISFPLSSHFQFKTSPGYVRRGAACFPGFGITFPNLIEDATVYANYVDLPILFQYNLPLKNRFSSFIQTGPGIAYMLGGYQALVFSDTNRSNEQQDLKFGDDSILNRLDVGLHVGLGVRYKIKGANIRLSGDYYHGLLDVTDTNTSQNRSLSIGLGYTVFIGGESSPSMD